MALDVPSVSSTVLSMAPLVTGCVLPSLPGLPMSWKPAQVHLITHQLAQASAWHGVSGSLGAPRQLVQLPCGVQIPPWCSFLLWLLPVPLPTAGDTR